MNKYKYHDYYPTIHITKKKNQIEIFVGVLSEIRREYKISKRVPQNYLARKKFVEKWLRHLKKFSTNTLLTNS